MEYFLQITAREEKVFLEEERNGTTVYHGSINDQRYQTNDQSKSSNQ